MKKKKSRKEKLDIRLGERRGKNRYGEKERSWKGIGLRIE